MQKPDDLGLVMRAVDFAVRQHDGQRRKDADVPYVTHPIAVARRLAEFGVDDPVTLAAALLHDTVEDTGATRADLAQRFGEHVADVVMEVTDDKSLPKATRKREQIRHAPQLSARARLVKLADKLDNLDGMTSRAPRAWGRDRVRGYFAWAHAVVAGLRGTHAGLEAALDAVFSGAVRMPGHEPFPALPTDPAERGALLDSYLASMTAASD